MSYIVITLILIIIIFRFFKPTEYIKRVPIKIFIISIIALLALTSLLTSRRKIDVTNQDIGFRTVSFIPESTGNGMKCDFNKFDGVRKLYEFSAKEEDVVNIKYQSDTLKMAVLDNENNIIHDFDINEGYDVDLVFKKSGKFSINIYGKGKNGSFEIEINPKDDMGAIKKCY